MTPTPLTATRPHIALGIGAAILTFATFSTMDMIGKILTTRYPLSQVIFSMWLFASLPLIIVVGRSGGIAALQTRRLALHIVRALIGLSAAFCAFFAFSRMPMADAYTLIFTAPLFMTAISALFLKEPVGWRRWAAVLVGFCGVVIIMQPGGGMMDIGMLGALGCALCFSTSAILVRILSRTEGPAAIMFYVVVTNTLVGGAIAVPDLVVPNVSDVMLMAAIGLLAGCANLTFIFAFTQAPAPVIAPFQYTQLIWGTMYGYFVFSDVPSDTLYVGAVIIVGSGLYILWRETIRSAPLAQQSIGRPPAPIASEAQARERQNSRNS